MKFNKRLDLQIFSFRKALNPNDSNILSIVVKFEMLGIFADPSRRVRTRLGVPEIIVNWDAQAGPDPPGRPRKDEIGAKCFFH